ncbi:MAG: type I pullulanase [Halanaerobiales bacterium]|nr:type I pullulanase [Halanaerobiales bacterium]
MVTVPVQAGSSTPIPENQVRLNYIRTDGEYDGWGLHLWGSGYDGPAIDWGAPFSYSAITDYGVYYDIPIKQGESDLNFIIHRENAKDPDGDRKYPNPNDNQEIFCVTGDSTVYLTLDEALTAVGIEKLDIPMIQDGHVRLHYYRFDENYEGWGLHLWGEGYVGEAVDWANPVSATGVDTYGVFWDIPYKETGDINFVIYKGNEKDTSADGNYQDPMQNSELWVVSSDEVTYASRLAALKTMSNEIDSAIIVGSREIEIQLRAAIKDPIRIKHGKKIIPVAKLDMDNEPFYKVIVRDDLDLTKNYTVEIGKLTSEMILSAEVIDENFVYDGELGNIYTPEKTSFKLWTPLASEVKLFLYEDGQGVEPDQTIDMVNDENGLWSVTVESDLIGKFYQYAVTNAGDTKIVLDPYVKSMAGFDSFNGSDKVGKGAIIDLERTNPVDWKDDLYVKVEDQEDVVIYEMSIRDFTISENSGVNPEKRGTYLGFIEKIPYLVDLGITHVQIQPIQNFYYGNEFEKSFENKGSADEANYNWGYDPHNYNTPEGWYSQNPADPHLRVKEVKELVKALHDAGIGVILDVVYNHTAKTAILEDIVSNYYYRRNEKGTFTSGSGCGNDTASERIMWNKFMVESTKYWVEEYHIDGFRFDLMGLHDERTMCQIAEILREINPNVVLHGEGWNMGTLPEEDRYIKGSNYNHSLLEMEHAIAVFNDTIRDAMKHEYFASPLSEGSFLQAANPNKEALIRSGIIAGMVNYESDVEVDTGFYNRFADDPEETITYVNCHDGYTIWDKIVGSTPNADENERIQINKLAAAMILTSQGKPFLHGGEEMLRSKPDPDNEEHGVDHNSYDSGDLTNQIDWSREEKYADTFNYYKGLIELRKAHEAFRMETMEEIQKGLTFIQEDIDYLIAYRLEEQDDEDEWNEIVVIYNANKNPQTVQIDGIDANWKVVVDGNKAGVTPLNDTEVVLGNGVVTVPAVSAVVIYR